MHKHHQTQSIANSLFWYGFSLYMDMFQYMLYMVVQYAEVQQNYYYGFNRSIRYPYTIGILITVVCSCTLYK